MWITMLITLSQHPRNKEIVEIFSVMDHHWCSEKIMHQQELLKQKFCCFFLF